MAEDRNEKLMKHFQLERVSNASYILINQHYLLILQFLGRFFKCWLTLVAWAQQCDPRSIQPTPNRSGSLHDSPS